MLAALILVMVFALACLAVICWLVTTQIAVLRAAITEIHQSVGQSVGHTARAVGEAVSVGSIPPPLPPPDPHQLARELFEQGYVPEFERQVDDSDPTDDQIGLVRERGEAAIVSANGKSPFGVPGLQFPTIQEQ